MRPPHLSVNLHPNRVGATLAGGPRPWFHVYSPATLYLTGPRTHHVYTGRRDLTKCRAAAYSSHLSRVQRGTAVHLSAGPCFDLSLNTIRFVNLSTRPAEHIIHTNILIGMDFGASLPQRGFWRGSHLGGSLARAPHASRDLRERVVPPLATQ